MQLYFIRHAQSENNALWELTGSDQYRSFDPKLTDVGLHQAQIVSEHLNICSDVRAVNGRDWQNRTSYGITHVYTSLMHRAVSTASLIANRSNLPLIAWPDLHEGGGLFLNDQQTGEPIGQPGPNRFFFTEHFPQLILPDWVGEQGWWNKPFELEAERLPRARRVIQELLARHGNTDNRVVFVSHGGFYNYLLRVLFDLPNDDRIWFVLNNTAITRLDFSDGRVEIIYHNQLNHLPTILIT